MNIKLIQELTVMKRSMQRLLPSKSSVVSGLSKNLFFQNLHSIEDFYIVLDTPHKVYKPGDFVTGSVIIMAKKPLISIILSLSINGIIKIFPGSNAISTKKSKLFSVSINLYGDKDSTKVSGLSKGEHCFPFSIRLPRRNIHSSIRFEKGSISYSLKANLHLKENLKESNNDGKEKHVKENGSRRSSMTKIKFTRKADNDSDETSASIPGLDAIAKCEKNITIRCPINVNKFSAPKPSLLVIKRPQKKFLKTLSSSSTMNSQNSVKSNGSNGSNGSIGTTKNSVPESMDDSNSSVLNNISGSFFAAKGAANNSSSTLSHSAIKVSVTTPSVAYLPNDLIPIQVNIQHIKNAKSTNGIIISLIRICKIDSSPDGQIQSFRKDLAQVVKPLYVDPSTLEFEVNANLKVPFDVFPTIRGAPLLSFEYFIEVIANLGSKGHSSFDDPRSELESKNAYKEETKPNVHRAKQESIDQEFINVDRLKRLKNVICLSRRIIIGTERLEVKKHKDEETSEGNSSNSIELSMISGGERQASSQENLPSPINGPDAHLSEPYDRIPTPPEVIDGVLINGATTSMNDGPPPINDSPPPINTEPAPPPISYEELAEQTQLTSLSEKETLMIHEQALLPSEPPMVFHQSQEDLTDIPTLSAIGRIVDVNRQSSSNHASIPEAQTEVSEDSGDISSFLQREVTDYVPVYEAPK